MKTKICAKCKKEKKISEYHKDKQRKSGIRPYCKDCFRENMVEYHKSSHWKKWKSNRTKIQKKEVIDNYGGKCGCCGEKQIEFLTIDHKNGGGAKHRKEIGVRLYWYLKKHNFPKNLGLRVLCMNCNMATRFGNVCPHKLKEK